MTPLMSLMHDTANTLDRLKTALNNLDKWKKEHAKVLNDVPNNTIVWVVAEYFRTGIKELQTQLDAYYIKQKEIENL